MRLWDSNGCGQPGGRLCHWSGEQEGHVEKWLFIAGHCCSWSEANSLCVCVCPSTSFSHSVILSCFPFSLCALSLRLSSILFHHSFFFCPSFLVIINSICLEVLSVYDLILSFFFLILNTYSSQSRLWTSRRNIILVIGHHFDVFLVFPCTSSI